MDGLEDIKRALSQNQKNFDYNSKDKPKYRVLFSHPDIPLSIKETKKYNQP